MPHRTHTHTHNIRHCMHREDPELHALLFSNSFFGSVQYCTAIVAFSFTFYCLVAATCCVLPCFLVEISSSHAHIHVLHRSIHMSFQPPDTNDARRNRPPD
ncbi:hypothetical protein BCR43DRAFT_485464 [Syncephalastrum racemosum]|uniref:Uncharacterized protein n=1 Tax=Syncephalastrum racemosum TaxID=13706 RepID=A0A1X2HMK2_SYNRA|nr:hypothetical protein BCR43DRAFT_485464 [Syncephalastrum racemosum]